MPPKTFNCLRSFAFYGPLQFGLTREDSSGGCFVGADREHDRSQTFQFCTEGKFPSCIQEPGQFLENLPMNTKNMENSDEVRRT